MIYEPGRVTGFLGPNGSGKSTTMKILLDLAAADHGTATIGGSRYRDLAAYFSRLEGLSRVVNIRRIRIESCPDTASVCAAQIEAVTYMAK